MIEAVMVLPVLVILLMALPLILERYAAKQQALLDARRCAWTYALSGCIRPPEGCGGFENAAAPAPGPDDDVIATARSQSGDGAGVFDLVPALTTALTSILGETALADVAVELRERNGVRRRVRAQLAVACNERPRDVLQMATQVFCENLPGLNCGDGS